MTTKCVFRAIMLTLSVSLILSPFLALAELLLIKDGVRHLGHLQGNTFVDCDGFPIEVGNGQIFRTDKKCYQASGPREPESTRPPELFPPTPEKGAPVAR